MSACLPDGPVNGSSQSQSSSVMMVFKLTLPFNMHFVQFKGADLVLLVIKV